jgi:hypothetical protein
MDNFQEWKERENLEEEKPLVKKDCFGKTFSSKDAYCKACPQVEECKKEYKETHTKMCYVCGKSGLGFLYIGLKEGVPLYRCSSAICSSKIVYSKISPKEKEEINLKESTPKIKIPYVSKYDILVKALKEGPKTMLELVELTESTPQSINVQFYLMAKKGIILNKEFKGLEVKYIVKDNHDSKK